MTTGLKDMRDPSAALATAVELRILTKQVQALAVRRAREQGWSWEQIAAALDVPEKGLRNASAR